jgi:hypothetical protein
MGLGNSYRSNDHRECVYEFSIPDRLIWSEIRAPAVFFASFLCPNKEMKTQSVQRNEDLKIKL